MTQRKAAFIIECGTKAGLGRLKRCLTLAQALKARGMAFDIFYDGKGAKEATLTFYPQAKAISEFFQHPERHGPYSLVILDHSNQNIFTAQQHGHCLQQTGAKLAIIDDLDQLQLAAEIIINPNLYGATLYKQREYAHIFAGPDYNLVDPRFFKENSKQAGHRKGIVLSFGGSDTGIRAAQFLESFLEIHQEINQEIHHQQTSPSPLPPDTIPAVSIPPINLPPVAIPIAGHISIDPHLEKLAQEYASIELIKNASMPTLFSAARFYVGSAGVMVQEALASGCDVFCCNCYQDQYLNYQFLQDNNIYCAQDFAPKSLAKAVALALQAPTLKAPTLHLPASGAATLAASLITTVTAHAL